MDVDVYEVNQSVIESHVNMKVVLLQEDGHGNAIFIYNGKKYIADMVNWRSNFVDGDVYETWDFSVDVSGQLNPEYYPYNNGEFDSNIQYIEYSIVEYNLSEKKWNKQGTGSGTAGNTGGN